MAEPRLHFRPLQPRLLSSPTIDEVLDEIYDALNNDTAWENVEFGTRTPGVGQAWTAERQQETGTTVAVGCIPPSGDVDDIRVLIAGHSGTPTPTMRAPDSFLANALLVSILKGVTAEVLTDWDGADPYDGGTFSGFWRGSSAVGTLTTLRIWESEETIIVSVHNDTTTVNCFMAGALWDSGTSSFGEGSTGKIYGMITGGSGTGQSGGVSWISTSIGFLDHDTGVGESHVGHWTPNTTTWNTGLAELLTKQVATITDVSANNLRTGNAIIGVPVISDGGYRLREFYCSVDTNHGNILLVDGSQVGCFIGRSFSTTADAVLILT